MADQLTTLSQPVLAVLEDSDNFEPGWAGADQPRQRESLLRLRDRGFVYGLALASVNAAMPGEALSERLSWARGVSQYVWDTWAGTDEENEEQSMTKRYLATLTIPAEFVGVIRAAVKGELDADQHEGAGDGEGMDTMLDVLSEHRDALAQLGWGDDTTDDTHDREVCLEVGYLAKRFEDAMGSISDELAASVGEYRRDKEICPDDVRRLGRRLDWLAATYDELPRFTTTEAVA